jgi:putative sigma-54 modulation protein
MTEDKRITERKTFEMKPMYEKEAILQMNLLGYNSFMFFNANIEKMCLIYKRKNGSYGLIEAAKL